MPIRSLELIQNSSLNNWIAKAQAYVLKDSIIAIDGFWFLRKYVQPGDMTDFFINKCDERILAPFFKLIKMASVSKFQILWVWDGLSFKKPKSDFARDNITLLKQGYEALKINDTKNLNLTWKSLIDYESYVLQINDLLKQFGHEAVRAPYLATAQIAYFLQNKICNYAFCKTDTLIFEGVEKIIIELHLENINQFMFTVFNKKFFMKHFELNHQSFKILAFALGCEFCPTLPEYADKFLFENVLAKVKNSEMDVYLEQQARHLDAYKKYQDIFYAAFILIDFHPVMKEEGIVSFYKDTEAVPNNFEDYFGKKLPSQIYKALFFCKLPVNVVDIISKNKEKDVISTISYNLLNSRYKFDNNVQDLKGSLLDIYTKDCKLLDDFSTDTQILIYYLILLKIINKQSADKMICLINIKKRMFKNEEILDCILNYDIYEFIYKSKKILQRLKDLQRCYNFVYEEYKNEDLKFDMDINMFLLLYYIKHKHNSEDLSINIINGTMKKIENFLKINISVNDEFKMVYDDIKKL